MAQNSARCLLDRNEFTPENQYMRRQIGISKILPLLLFFLFAGICLFMLSLLRLLPSSIKARKFLNCFASWNIYYTYAAICVLCAVFGTGALRTRLRDMRATTVWLFFAVLGLIAIWAGWGFQTMVFAHASLTWDTPQYMEVMGYNWLRCMIPTAAAIVAALSPEKAIPNKGLLRPVCLSVAIMLLTYVLASWVYLVGPSFEME